MGCGWAVWHKHEDINDLKTGSADLIYFTASSEGLFWVWDSSGNRVREIINVSLESKTNRVCHIKGVDNCLIAANNDGNVKLLRFIQF